MRMAIEAAGVAAGLVLVGAAQAADMGATVDALLRRDAEQAIAGEGSAVRPPARGAELLIGAPPVLPVAQLAAPVLPATPPGGPAVTAIYGQPGALRVVLNVDGKQVVLDQATGRARDGHGPYRLTGVSGACAQVALAARRTPSTLCVPSSFGVGAAR